MGDYSNNYANGKNQRNFSFAHRNIKLKKKLLKIDAN